MNQIPNTPLQVPSQSLRRVTCIQRVPESKAKPESHNLASKTHRAKRWSSEAGTLLSPDTFLVPVGLKMYYFFPS